MTPTNNSIIAKVNNVPIIVFDKEKLVPIKPICEALGIDVDSQRKKINDDEILSSTAVLSTSVAADKKEREMFCIPLKYVFGWLFSINHKNVKPEAQEAVKKYKLECYSALYRHFGEYAEFVEERQKLIYEKMDRIKEAKVSFRETRNNLYKEEGEMDQIRMMTFNDWKDKHSQLSMEFTEEKPGPIDPVNA